jgi:hypothetical protein
MDRAEAIAVKRASQSMGDTMDLAAEIRLAIVEVEQAAAREMRDRCIAARPEDAYQSTGMNWWEEEMCTLPLPTQALDLALERARLEEAKWWIDALQLAIDGGVDIDSPDYRRAEKRLSAHKAKVSALEQAQREGND